MILLKIFTTKIIDQKSKFKWITHYSDDPEKEVKNIISAVNTIKSKQQNAEKYIVITDYQFIFSSFKLSNAVIVNKLYGYGVSYPTNKNPNYIKIACFRSILFIIENLSNIGVEDTNILETE